MSEKEQRLYVRIVDGLRRQRWSRDEASDEALARIKKWRSRAALTKGE